jgi:hypothetical protein
LWKNEFSGMALVMCLGCDINFFESEINQSDRHKYIFAT